MSDSPKHLRGTVFLGWLLLALAIPAGLTLEALHALKVEVYLGSALRRELWTLAHAHGNLLGILCLVYAVLAERWVPDPKAQRSVSRWLRTGAVLMPLGFFAGGVLNFEGDPSFGVLLVPVGGVCLVVALTRAAFAACSAP
ncbi:MAG: hypothetical protein QGG14_07955 [Planctomycetota bacterium]|nr:hypothetical protein [Planctomycetota bacterium]